MSLSRIQQYIAPPSGEADVNQLRDYLGSLVNQLQGEAFERIRDFLDIESRTITFNIEHDNGNSGATDTIDWSNGQKQKSTLTGNVTYTFTDPNGPGNFTLRLIQDATGSRTVTWPATVKWPGGIAPVLSVSANAEDIVTLYFNGTTYYGDYGTNYETTAQAVDARVRAYLAADQENIADDTWTKVTLDTENYDTGADFDSTTNYRFTAPVTGYYQINAMIRWVNTDAGTYVYHGAIYTNGAVSHEHVAITTASEPISNSFSDAMYLEATDYIELYVYHNNGSSTVDIDGGSKRTYMSVHLLSTYTA